MVVDRKDEEDDRESDSGSDDYGPKYNRSSLVNFDGDDPYYENVVKKSHTTFMVRFNNFRCPIIFIS